MKQLPFRTSKLVVLSFIVILTGLLVVSCEETTQPEDHHHELEVTLSYTPTPATVNTEITFTFEVEEAGEHVSVSDVSCEIGKVGSGSHQDMAVSADPDEAGHYTATWTFAEAGTYEIHFHFKHDNEMDEREFQIEVQ